MSGGKAKSWIVNGAWILSVVLISGSWCLGVGSTVNRVASTSGVTLEIGRQPQDLLGTLKLSVILQCLGIMSGFIRALGSRRSIKLVCVQMICRFVNI